MNVHCREARGAAGVAVPAAAAALLCIVAGIAAAQESARTAFFKVSASAGAILNGEQEVPAVASPASAVSTIHVDKQRRVTGMIETSNIDGTSAHIHAGAAGSNGPVVVALVRTADDRWKVPADTRLSEEDYDRYENGYLYVDVHSADNPDGEIRLQLR